MLGAAWGPASSMCRVCTGARMAGPRPCTASKVSPRTAVRRCQAAPHSWQATTRKRNLVQTGIAAKGCAGGLGCSPAVQSSVSGSPLDPLQPPNCHHLLCGHGPAVTASLLPRQRKPATELGLHGGMLCLEQQERTKVLDRFPYCPYAQLPFSEQPSRHNWFPGTSQCR